MRDGKLTHMRCKAPDLHDFFQDWKSRDSICQSYDTAYRESVRNGWEILPLLFCCRQIYLEFVEMVYSSITFQLPNNAAERFITIVPQTSLALAHLHLQYGVHSPMYVKAQDWT
ncbi:hypothetical protein ONS96_013430 [Cadophora gregata f. sp. sojae]|nr:hypothetical protein ONS96_013430 [Cadophora gregata f. sp. sojae]